MINQSTDRRSAGTWKAIVQAILAQGGKRQERAALLYRLLTEVNNSKRRRINTQLVLDLLAAELPTSYYEGHGGRDAA